MMIRWHFMEIYTWMELCKCSLSSCDWLKQLINITLGFVPPALWLHVNPSLPLHVHQSGLCLPCHELLNWVFKPCSNNSKKSSKSAIPYFSLSLNTRSICILISVLFFFVAFRERKNSDSEETHYVSRMEIDFWRPHLRGPGDPDCADEGSRRASVWSDCGCVSAGRTVQERQWQSRVLGKEKH